MGIGIVIIQFILSLSILVVLHEFGHFLPAKLFKTKVEKFYLFFNPWFSLFKVKKGETEYGLGWLPLGGYVKIAGMIDESMDKEQMKQPAQPWEFRSKPAWQRLIIMVGGVVVNFLLGFLIFAFILFHWGESYLPAENVTYGIAVDSVGRELGLEEGDRVLAVGDVELDRFSDRVVIREIVLNDARTITVERNGNRREITVDPKYTRVFSSSSFRDQVLFAPRVPFEISRLVKNSPAEEAGLQKGDRIVALNGEPTPYFSDFARAIRDKANQQISVTVERGGQRETYDIQLDEDSRIGAFNKQPQEFLEFERKKYGFFEAIPVGIDRGVTFLWDQIKAFGKMFSGEIKASDSLGGFGTIGSLFPQQWDWEAFWRVTAILSLILGFMNLLPIPALDGGHVVFLLWEVVTGRKPGDKFMEYATIVGFVIIIGLVLYANWLDVARWLDL